MRHSRALRGKQGLGSLGRARHGWRLGTEDMEVRPQKT